VDGPGTPTPSAHLDHISALNLDPEGHSEGESVLESQAGEDLGSEQYEGSEPGRSSP